MLHETSAKSEVPVFEWKNKTKEKKREVDSTYRSNKHDFNCEGGNDSFITVSCAVYVFSVLFLFSFKIDEDSIVSLK